ncbi:MAG: EAL domain-containing protein, partial [Actinomycetota bacterium]|nr:EAL domain-containing protein [Actinomycetota bacterium]
ATHRRKVLDAGTGRTSIRVIEARETHIIEDLSKTTRMRTLKREGARTVVVVPIRAGANTMGVLTLATRKIHEPSSGQLAVLETMGNHLGIVLQKTLLQEQLTRQALYDDLTGLANRVLLYERLNQALELGRRQGTSIAVLFVDLDRFKAVNDTLGHAAGDRVLVAVAERLSECIRGCDTASRLGGDEFAILLNSPSDMASARTAAGRVLQALRTPVEVDGHFVAVTPSVGVAVSCMGDTPDTLLQDSDVAMYDAKSRGGGRISTYRTAMRTAVQANVDFQERLTAAVHQNAFHLHYQPIVDVRSLRSAGFEALLRWDDPVTGSVSPRRFIPALEANGLIKCLGRWVIQQACRDAAMWQKRYPSLTRYVSVNVSAQQLKQRDFVSSVREALDESQLSAELLVLEITESMLVRETELVAKRLTEVRDLGIRIAVDDFGTGYSSLSYLRMFPLDILKIDKTFIEAVPRNADAAALLAAIIDLGIALGLDVITEGVENPAQAKWLGAARCLLAQGFHYAKPMPAGQILAHEG